MTDSPAVTIHRRRGVSAVVFTTVPVLAAVERPGVQAGRHDLLAPAARPGDGAGGGDRADATAGGQPRNQVVHDSVPPRTVDLDSARRPGRIDDLPVRQLGWVKVGDHHPGPFGSGGRPARPLPSAATSVPGWA